MLPTLHLLPRGDGGVAEVRVPSWIDCVSTWREGMPSAADVSRDGSASSDLNIADVASNGLRLNALFFPFGSYLAVWFGVGSGCIGGIASAIS